MINLDSVDRSFKNQLQIEDAEKATFLSKLNFEIVVPLLLTVATCVEYFDLIDIDAKKYLIMAWFSQIVFMNTIHVAFPLGAYLFMPEFKLMRQKQLNLNNVNLDCQFFSVHIILFFIFLGIVAVWGHGSLLDSNGEILILGAIFPNLHALNQQKGISFLYNNLFLNKASDGQISYNKVRFQKLMTLERRAFQIFTWSFVCGSLARGLPRAFDLTSPYFVLVWKFCLGLSLISFLLIFAIGLSSMFYFKSTKALFVFRLLSWPLCFLTWIGNIGIMSSHGLEANSIFQRFIGNSEINGKDLRNLKIFLMSFITFLIALTSISFFRFLSTDYFQENHWRFAYPLIMVFAYSHYWLDHQIFKLNDPITKSSTSKLLFNFK